MTILIYILLIIFTYYTIRSLDKYICKRNNQEWIWDWTTIFIVILLSLFTILGLFIVLITELAYFIKLPKNPPKWL